MDIYKDIQHLSKFLLEKYLRNKKTYTFAVTVVATLPALNSVPGRLFCFYTMKYNKLPIDIPEQLELLKQRGLLIDDERTAISVLQNISYFRLANYWHSMERDKCLHHFKTGSKFDDVLALYDFDIRLREIVFSAIQKVEIALRSKVVHHFSLCFGPFWFSDSALFKDKGIHSLCVGCIENEIRRTKEDFILDYFEKYTSPIYPPAWKTIEIISFGTLSKLYCNFADKSVKKIVAEEFGIPQHIILESWLRSIVVLRNYCAHHARIWNRSFSIKPCIPKTLIYPWIGSSNCNPSKLYPQLCGIVYLSSAVSSDNDFKDRLITLINNNSNVDLKAMGFTAEWGNEPLWL